jgi:hypothetical protein
MTKDEFNEFREYLNSVEWGIDMSLIRISESDDWIVDYDRERGMYRVSYFEDSHYGRI